MTDKLLHANIKAAEMCGRIFAHDRKTVGVEEPVWSGSWNGHKAWREFDIFSRSDDREATVIALGEKHGYCICYHDGDDGGWWVGDDEGYVVGNTNYYTTYIEAIAAAVEAV